MPLTRAICAIAVLALTACDRTPCQPGACGTIIFVTTSEPETLSPLFSTTTDARDVWTHYFEYLADLGPNLTTVGDTGFVPKLAESWLREDSLTLSFRLRRDARWHDGQPVTVGDVVFSFDIARDPDAGSRLTALLQRVASVEARDSSTVVVRFGEAYPLQLYDAAFQVPILPAHRLRSVPRGDLRNAAFWRDPIGSGPYRFVSWDQGVAITLAANEDYWGPTPAVGRLVFRGVAGPDAVANALIAEEADASEVFVLGPLREQLARTAHLRPYTLRSFIYSFAAFNFRDPRALDRPHPILSDVRVRRALVRAFDSRRVVQDVFGDAGFPAFGPVTRAHWIWTDSLMTSAYDPEAAGRLLEEAGWRDRDGDGIRERNGRPLRLRMISIAGSRTREQYALFLRDAWRQIGVDLELDESAPPVREDKEQRGDFDVSFTAWASDPDPGATVREQWTTGGPVNWWRYSSARYDSLVTSGLRERDVSRARRIWHESVAQLQRDAPAVFLYEIVFTAWVHQRVQNVSIRPDSWWDLVPEWTMDWSQALPRDGVARQ